MTDVALGAAPSKTPIHVQGADYLLQGLIASLTPGGHLPVTLLVGGLLVTGELVTGRAYFNALAALLESGMAGDADVEAHLQHFVEDLRDELYPVSPEGDQPTASLPEYVHLLDARVSLPGLVGGFSGPVVGVPWRGPLRAIDGFILGRVADQE